jgi:hypothetical protein
MHIPSLTRKVLALTAIAIAALGLAAGVAWSRYSTESSNPIAQQLLSGDQLTPLQRKILEDGVVTPAEYQQAREATFSCLEQNGLQPEKDRAGIYASVPDPHVGNQDAVGAIVKSCVAAGVEPIDRVLALQSVPEEREAAAQEVLAQCLRAEGFSAPDRPTADDIRALLASAYGEGGDPDSAVAILRCADQAELARRQ